MLTLPTNCFSLYDISSVGRQEMIINKKTKKIKESLANSIAAEKTKQKEQDARI